MPIFNRLFPQHNLLYMDHAGAVTATDVATNYSRILAMPGSHRLHLVLVDLRRLAEMRAYFDGMASVAHIIASDGETRPKPWEIAIVSDNTGHLPLLLDYARQVRRSGSLRCDVLPTMDKALTWLGLPPGVQSEIERARANQTADR